jgi:8-oxo-dGTP diphosphatase
MEHFPAHIVAVGGYITNAADEVLMILSPMRGWEFPGGQVELGESLFSALVREVKEETGLIVSPRKLIGIYSNLNTGNPTYPSILNFDFSCQFIEGDFCTSSESLEVAWVNKARCMEMATSSMIKYRLGKMLKQSCTPTYSAYTTNPFKLISEVQI